MDEPITRKDKMAPELVPPLKGGIADQIIELARKTSQELEQKRAAERAAAQEKKAASLQTGDSHQRSVIGVA